MRHSEAQAHLNDAFERIEETILPCIAMMLETLIDASEAIPGDDRRFLAAELETLATELDALTKLIEDSSPAQVEPGEYRARGAA
jgi:hypothetical protein